MQCKVSTFTQLQVIVIYQSCCSYSSLLEFKARCRLAALPGKLYYCLEELWESP